MKQQQPSPQQPQQTLSPETMQHGAGAPGAPPACPFWRRGTGERHDCGSRRPGRRTSSPPLPVQRQYRPGSGLPEWRHHPPAEMGVGTSMYASAQEAANAPSSQAAAPPAGPRHVAPWPLRTAASQRLPRARCRQRLRPGSCSRPGHGWEPCSCQGYAIEGAACCPSGNLHTSCQRAPAGTARWPLELSGLFLASTHPTLRSC